MTDARQVIAQQQIFAIGGAVIHTSSPDSGDRLAFTDVSGKPVYTEDSRGHKIRHTYDALLRPTGIFVTDDTEPEIQVVKTVYGESQAAPEVANLRGQVYQVFDGAGVVTNDSYDFKGNVLQTTRQLAVDYKTAPDWSADADPAPTLETETFTTEFAYDALSRVTEKTTPDESVTKPAFNKTGLLKSVSVQVRGAATATDFVTDIDYDAKGQRTKIAYGNGAETTYTYDDETFRLTRLLTTRTSDSKVLQDFSYTYDPVGNITNGVDAAQETVYFSGGSTDGTRAYTYDPLYRLIEATGREHSGQQPQWQEFTRYGITHPNDSDALVRYTQVYTYDAVGNIDEMDHTASGDNWTQRYTYASNSNRLASTVIGGGTVNYTHDDHGNMFLPHLTVQAWDHFDRLQKTSTQSASSGTPETTYYVYDASGERVRKVTENYAAEGSDPTRKSETIYTGGYEIFRDYQSDVLDNERETLHVNDDQKRVAMVETKTVTSGSAVSTPVPRQRYQHGDHLGSSSVETSDTGQVITYEEYYPFGGTSFHQPTSAGNYSVKRYRYTGKERDEESGFYYHGARYYAPWLGRWTSADPAGMVDGPNLYAYVKNNPVMFHDPSGTNGETNDSDLMCTMEDAPQDSGNDPTLNYEDKTCDEIPLCTDEGVGSGVGDDSADPLMSIEEPEKELSTESSDSRNATAAPDSEPQDLSKKILTGGFLLAGALAADDITVAGFADDIAIPPLIAGTLFAAGIAALSTSLSKTSTQAKTRAKQQKDFKYVTYTKHNPLTGQTYVGRTSGSGNPDDIVAKRDVNHHKNKEGYDAAIVDRFAIASNSLRHNDPAYLATRGREQQLMDFFGGPWSDQYGIDRETRIGATRSGNAIRGVAKWNPRGLLYHEAANAMFGEKHPYTGYFKKQK